MINSNGNYKDCIRSKELLQLEVIRTSITDQI
jgi:hypothetical protein